MINHLFKLTWNKKKQHFLLIVEIFISFLVMFAIFTLVVHYYSNYRKPMGFSYENVWAVNFSIPEVLEGILPRYTALTDAVRSVPGVQEVAMCSNNLPFSMNTSNSVVEYKNNSALTHMYAADDDYDDVLGVEMAEGRWFNKTDDATRDKPVIINKRLKDKFFPNENAVGKSLGSPTDRWRIVGVVHDMKDKGNYQAPDYALYKRQDTSWYLTSLLVKVKPNSTAADEGRLYKVLSNTLKDSNVEIEHLSRKRINKNKMTLVPMIIMMIVGGFLIINVALGLFGVLWYNINKRRGEIGLRRAVGASGNNVSLQLIGEALVLSTLSLLLGCFFAIQFPLLNVFDLSSATYIAAIVLAVLFIYMLVIFCALYPGKQAALIYPAVALHED